MLEISARSEQTQEESYPHIFLKLELREEQYQPLLDALISFLPDQYIDPESVSETLVKLGKIAAADKVKLRIPEDQKIRSGDIGEILATDYVRELGYDVPIQKLRWRDHRNMAMRGDDVIGILVDAGIRKINFIKVEAKANRSMSTAVLEKARQELDMDDGLPAPHALSFLSERLREIGNEDLGDRIEKAQLVEGISQNQITHLLFTFSASDPSRLQKTEFSKYDGQVKQLSVGFRVARHEDLVEGVFQRVENGLND